MVAFAYCQYKDNCSAQGILCGLLNQVLLQRPEALPVIEELYTQYSIQGNCPSIPDASRTLKTILGLLDLKHIVIDGLDEIHEEEQRLSLLDELRKISAPVLIFSRPLNLFEFPRFSAASLSIEARTEDIAIFVESSISAHPRLSSFASDTPGFSQKVVDALQDKSKGM